MIEPIISESNAALAQQCYEIYQNHFNSKAIDWNTDPLPSWEDLDPKVRDFGSTK